MFAPDVRRDAFRSATFNQLVGVIKSIGGLAKDNLAHYRRMSGSTTSPSTSNR
jgi:hypothetical protein